MNEDELRAEVARLQSSLNDAARLLSAQHDGWVAENARLTAEVERLKGREQAAKLLITAIKEDGIGVVFCPCCWKYWTEDASGCADGCARAAWLAGCKS